MAFNSFGLFTKFAASSSVSSTDNPSTPTQPTDVSNFFQNMWSKIVDFFKNEATSLLLKIAIAILVIVLVHYLNKLIDHIIFKSLHRTRKKKKNGIEIQPLDVSVISFIQSVVKFVIWIIVVFILLSMFNFDISSLGTILAGAVAGISLSLQSLISNFAYGVVIISSRMVKTDDYIIGEGYEGTIKSINMLFIILETVDGKKVFVPNEKVATSPLQDTSSVPVRSLRVDFRVSCSADIDVLRADLTEQCKHEKRIMQDRPIVLLATDLDGSSVGLSLRVYVSNEEYWDELYSLNEIIAKTLRKYSYPLSQNAFSIVDKRKGVDIAPAKQFNIPNAK